MDTWYKYRAKQHKQDLNKVDVPKMVAYGNYLIHTIAWKAANNKCSQKLLNKFFDVASLVLQATLAQKSDATSIMGAYEYIDQITKDLSNGYSTSAQELGLMIGNLSEIEDGHYTFTELIAFMRLMGTRI